MGEVVSQKLMIHVNDTNVRPILATYIIELLGKQQDIRNRQIIILCIGSDRYIGDALGPLIGSYLQEHTNFIVYGNLDKPVHAGNLVQVIDHIENEYDQPVIIAIDACLGKSYEIGNVEIWQGSLAAGIAVGAKLPCVGHISIVGVVNASSYIGYLDLQSTHLGIVMKLSNCISSALSEALRDFSIDDVI